jgi:hypothetical protein
VPYARHRREGHGVRGGPVHRLGEIGEERLHGAGGVGDLFGEEFEPDDLVGVRVARGGHLAGTGEVAGQSRVDEVGGDAAAPQQSAARLQDAQFSAAGEIAGRWAVRFEAQQGRAPAAHGEAGLGVEEGGAGRGWSLTAGEVGLERAEAQLRSQYAVAVLIHEGRRFDHPDSPSLDRCAPTGPNG